MRLIIFFASLLFATSRAQTEDAPTGAPTVSPTSSPTKCSENVLFTGSHCGKSPTEDCDGTTCTQVGTSYPGSLADCQKLCREDSDCNFITYTESRRGDCDLYDACPSSKISECCADAITTPVCGSATTCPINFCPDGKNSSGNKCKSGYDSTCLPDGYGCMAGTISETARDGGTGYAVSEGIRDSLECAELCLNDPDCKSFSFSPGLESFDWYNYCYTYHYSLRDIRDGRVSIFRWNTDYDHFFTCERPMCAKGYTLVTRFGENQICTNTGGESNIGSADWASAFSTLDEATEACANVCNNRARYCNYYILGDDRSCRINSKCASTVNGDANSINYICEKDQHDEDCPALWPEYTPNRSYDGSIQYVDRPHEICQSICIADPTCIGILISQQADELRLCFIRLSQFETQPRGGSNSLGFYRRCDPKEPCGENGNNYGPSLRSLSTVTSCGCAAACDASDDCKAWTYVSERGVQGMERLDQSGDNCIHRSNFGNMVPTTEYSSCGGRCRSAPKKSGEFGECFGSTKTVSQQDYVCEGDLVCARDGYDGRIGVGCSEIGVAGPPFNIHCCVQYDGPTDNPFKECTYNVIAENGVCSSFKVLAGGALGYSVEACHELASRDSDCFFQGRMFSLSLAGGCYCSRDSCEFRYRDSLYAALYEADCSTQAPTSEPSSSPTEIPTYQPSPTTMNPSKQPSGSPSKQPTPSPTQPPSLSPTREPSTSPTTGPTLSPTTDPSPSPTENPTAEPSKTPSMSPTLSVETRLSQLEEIILSQSRLLEDFNRLLSELTQRMEDTESNVEHIDNGLITMGTCSASYKPIDNEEHCATITDPCDCVGDCGWSTENDICGSASEYRTTCTECDTFEGCITGSCLTLADNLCPTEYNEMRICQCNDQCRDFGNCCWDVTGCGGDNYERVDVDLKCDVGATRTFKLDFITVENCAERCIADGNCDHFATDLHHLCIGCAGVPTGEGIGFHTYRVTTARRRLSLKEELIEMQKMNEQLMKIHQELRAEAAEIMRE